MRKTTSTRDTETSPTRASHSSRALATLLALGAAIALGASALALAPADDWQSVHASLELSIDAADPTFNFEGPDWLLYA
jgi:hypothetical protein